jgi:hypothetical protein
LLSRRVPQDHLMLMDFNPAVRAVSSQPFWLRWRDEDGRARRHAPEYRTLPMVWYIPPLSPVADTVTAVGYDADAPDQVFAASEALRVPAEYLANLFTAGDPGPVRRVLRTLAAIRTFMRAGQFGLDVPDGLAESVGATETDLEDLYRLLAIAKYDERYVIPPAHAEDAGRLMAQHEQLFCAQPGRPRLLPPARRRAVQGRRRAPPPGPVTGKRP